MVVGRRFGTSWFAAQACSPNCTKESPALRAHLLAEGGKDAVLDFVHALLQALHLALALRDRAAQLPRAWQLPAGLRIQRLRLAGGGLQLLLQSCSAKEGLASQCSAMQLILPRIKLKSA